MKSVSCLSIVCLMTVWARVARVVRVLGGRERFNTATPTETSSSHTDIARYHRLAGQQDPNNGPGSAESSSREMLMCCARSECQHAELWTLEAGQERQGTNNSRSRLSIINYDHVNNILSFFHLIGHVKMFSFVVPWVWKNGTYNLHEQDKSNSRGSIE